MKKRLSAFLLAAVMMLGLLPGVVLEGRAANVTAEQLVSNELIGEHQPSKSMTCSVYACWYMTRRYIALKCSYNEALGIKFSDFQKAATGKENGYGVLARFDYVAPNAEKVTVVQVDLYQKAGSSAMNVVDLANKDSEIKKITGGEFLCQRNDNDSTDVEKLKTLLRYLLSIHPEGVEIWAYLSSEVMHSVLITGYDAKTGEFLCADPGKWPNGNTYRGNLGGSLLGSQGYANSSKQDDILKWVCRFHVIETPLCVKHEYKTEKQDGIWNAVCKKCGTPYNYGQVISEEKGVYKVIKADNQKGCSAPYKDSVERDEDSVAQAWPVGTQLNVVGYVINAYGNKWYHLDDNTWIYSGHVKKIGNSNVTSKKPAVPGGLSAKTESTTAYTAKVSWVAVAGATSYEVQFCTSDNPGPNGWNTDKDYKNNTAISYESTGLRDRDWYEYRVRAVNQHGASDWSDPVRYQRDYGQRAVPGNLNVKTESASEYTATVSWTAAPGATSYEVQYRTSADATWKTDNDYKTKTATAYVSTGLRDRDWYDYRVRAVNQEGPSNWSSPVRYTRDHVHSYTAVVTKPTCTAGGYTTHTCTCGASYKDSNTAALGHTYRNDVSAFTYVCANCGDSYERCPFADVTEKDWFYNAVEYVVTEGVMSGYSAGKFGPNDTLNRAMVVQLLYNKEGQPSQAGIKHGFSDVPTKQWFNNAVTWGSRRGIVSGFGGGLFKPEDAVTLEQIAVILWNYAGKPAASGRPAKAGLHNSWAANALSWCEAMGILDGVPFKNATEKATRAQAAQILANYLG